MSEYVGKKWNEARVTRDNLTCLIGKDVKPVLTIDLPARITFETIDVFRGALKSEEDTLEGLDYDTINPATGPVYFNGLKPGDVLEIKIKRVHVDSPAAAICCPDEGLLGDLIKKGKTKMFSWDTEYNVNITDKIKIQAKPMIGVMGVAAADKTWRTIEPGDHGGNMDTTILAEGATLYLPVFVEGGLFSTGDLHASQGDGESWYTGIEAGGEVELEFNVRRDMKISIPFCKNSEKFASIASDYTTDDALKKAMLNLVNFISVDNGNGELTWDDAGFVCGTFANLEISQVVDPLKSARMSLPLSAVREMVKCPL